MIEQKQIQKKIFLLHPRQPLRKSYSLLFCLCRCEDHTLLVESYKHTIANAVISLATLLAIYAWINSEYQNNNFPGVFLFQLKDNLR